MRSIAGISGVAVAAILALSLTGCQQGWRHDCAGDRDNCADLRCCNNPAHRCYEKDASWSTCRPDCMPGLYAGDPEEYRTPWSCKLLDKTAKPVELQCSGLSIDGAGGQTHVLGAGGRASGGELRLKHDSGFSVVSACSEDPDPKSFTLFSLVGKTLSFSVHLGQASCACNVAFYLVSMPARDPGGGYSLGSCDTSPYYCDANKVCGQLCPEVDLMEANSHAFQATPHKCDPPTNGHYSSCDGAGCGGQNTKAIPNGYGWGSQFTIDTTKTFSVHTYFPETAGALSGMVTTLTQEGRQLVLENLGCSPAYFGQLGAALAAGMSLRITYWGKDAATMGWLDQPPCGGEYCVGDGAGDVTITDIRVEGGATTTSKPASEESAYETLFVVLLVTLICVIAGSLCAAYVQRKSRPGKKSAPKAAWMSLRCEDETLPVR